MPLEKSQIYSTFFLLMISLPFLLSVSAYVPFLNPDVGSGAILAALIAFAILNFVSTKQTRLIILGIMILLAPTGAFYFANPTHLTNKDFGSYKLATTQSEFIAAATVLGPFTSFLSFLSLIPSTQLTIANVRRDNILITKKTIKDGMNSDLFPGIKLDQDYKLLFLRTQRKVKGRSVLLDTPVLVPQFHPIKDEDYAGKRQVFPAWHLDYEPTESELQPPYRGAPPPDADRLWFSGRLVSFDADAALERGVEKKVKHVRRVALVCDNGGGIGHGPEGSAVTASMLLLLPVVLLLLWWRFDPSGEEEVGAVVRRAPRKKACCPPPGLKMN